MSLFFKIAITVKYLYQKSMLVLTSAGVVAGATAGATAGTITGAVLGVVVGAIAGAVHQHIFYHFTRLPKEAENHHNFNCSTARKKLNSRNPLLSVSLKRECLHHPRVYIFQ